MWVVTFAHCIHCVFEHVRTSLFVFAHICVLYVHLCLCVENMSSPEDWRGGGGSCLCVSGLCVFAGGRMGGVIVSLGRCVCVCILGGEVCRSRNSLLGWSDLRERERRVLGVCVKRTLLYIQTLKEGTTSSAGTVQM